jgi:peptidoglycan/LPS O-acetylase OafA/YrhL
VNPGFRQDIQGLRALAVVLVILDHAGIGPFHGGFIGVDVFFVISGFLITGLLVSSAPGGSRCSASTPAGRAGSCPLRPWSSSPRWASGSTS